MSVVPTRAELQAAFLAAYEIHGTLSHASRASGVGRTTHYDWLDSDPTYAARFRHSYEVAVDVAELELRRRGIEGTLKPVFYQGEECGHIREYSDACLIFYLKGRRSDVFRDRAEISGPGGGPVEHSVASIDITAMPIERLRQIRAWMLEAQGSRALPSGEGSTSPNGTAASDGASTAPGDDGIIDVEPKP